MTLVSYDRKKGKNQMDKNNLQEMILSEEYVDLIRNFRTTPEEFLKNYSELGAQVFGDAYGMLHLRIDLQSENPMQLLGYSSMPKLFSLLDTTSLEVSGILKVQTQPLLGFEGKDVIIGFIDTGIDYTLPVFQTSDGRTRILQIWDQSIPSEDPPSGFGYGTIYHREQIQEALDSTNPEEIVPSIDSNGHGTHMAAIAAGSPDVRRDFIGAAPKADIAVVKLKGAKQNLRDFFLIERNAVAFQETDVMMGVKYLSELSYEMQKPVVICLGLGSNQGSHTGQSPLAELLSYYTGFSGCYATVAGGNEAGKAHHFYGLIPQSGETENVEILVDEKTEGFSLELWSYPPQQYSVGLISPLGEVIERIPARLGQSTTIRFVLERTVVELFYEIVEISTGNELILLRFKNPTPGIWNVKVYNDNYINGTFHMWLPITGFISPGTVFLRPNPDTTLTTPSAAPSVITVSTYNAYNNSIYINSSRGYTKSGFIKPDIASPGVDIISPGRNGIYEPQTGSSAASAITAGAIALLVNWGEQKNPNRYFTSQEVQGFLIRGATRKPSLSYPNQEWGYGALNLYRIFETLMNL